MKSYPLFFIVGFLALFFHPSAWAAAYKVEIRQIGQQGLDYAILCNDHEICFLTLALPIQNKAENDDRNYIDVAVKLDSETAYFQFIHNHQYLAVTSIGKDVLEMPLHKPGSHAVKLYMPHPASKNDQQGSLRSSPVLRVSGNILAELEISIHPEL